MRNRLSQVFRVAMVPSQDTISAMFYLKDGGTVYLKDEVRIPKEAMEQEAWYRQALAKPNVVSVGAFDTSRQNLTYSRLKSGEFVLAAASHPTIRRTGPGKWRWSACFLLPMWEKSSADSTGMNSWGHLYPGQRRKPYFCRGQVSGAAGCWRAWSQGRRGSTKPPWTPRKRTPPGIHHGGVGGRGNGWKIVSCVAQPD